MASTAQKTTDKTDPIPTFQDGQYIWEKSYPKNRKWKQDFEAKPLYKLMDDAVEKYADFPLMDFMGKVYSYKKMGELVEKATVGLQNLGVTKGKKVGLFLPNSPYSVILFYATLKAGGTVVNFNPLYAEKELIYQVEDSETDIMVTLNLKVLLPKVEALLHKTRLNNVIVCPMQDSLPFPKNLLFPILKRDLIQPIPEDDRYITFPQLIDNTDEITPVEIDVAEDIAVLQYTGGTTGVPKGAMLTHKNLYSNTLQITHWLGSAEAGKDSQVGVLPFFHVFAMTIIMNMSIHLGIKILAVPKFDIDDVLKLINDEKPTFLPAVPAIFNAMATHKDIAKYDFSSLKFCLSGGAPLPADVKRAFEENTGAQRVAEGYGLTETSPVATCNPVEGVVKTGSIGLPLPNTIIEIIDREDGVTILPVGEKGEVCITGPQVMKGYYNKEEATNDTIRNGRLHTGDVGYIDEEGYVFLVDRIKDLILVRGYNVYPRHIEEAIYEHPSVEECIVAGVPDKERGETVWAWVKPMEGRSLTEQDLLDSLKDKISPIEMPRKIIFRSEALPKTDVGKLSRKDLLEQEGIKRPLG